MGLRRRDVTSPGPCARELHLKVALRGREDCLGVGPEDSPGKVAEVSDEVDEVFFADVVRARVLAEDGRNGPEVRAWRCIPGAGGLHHATSSSLASAG